MRTATEKAEILIQFWIDKAAKAQGEGNQYLYNRAMARAKIWIQRQAAMEGSN